MLASYHRRFRASVTTPSWTMRLPREVLRRDLTAFLAPQAEQSRLVISHDDPSVRSADEVAAIDRFEPLMSCAPPCRTFGNGLEVRIETGKEGGLDGKLSPPGTNRSEFVEDRVQRNR